MNFLAGNDNRTPENGPIGSKLRQAPVTKPSRVALQTVNTPPHPATLVMFPPLRARHSPGVHPHPIRSRWTTILALVLVGTVLGGCLGNESASPEKTPVQEELPFPDLLGQVSDQDGRPVVDARIHVPGANRTTHTNETGDFAFHELDLRGPVLIEVGKTGHINTTQVVQFFEGFSVLLNVTLADISRIEPFQRAAEFKGFLGCRANLHAAGTTLLDRDCSREAQSITLDTWDASVDFGVQAAVIELFWNARTPAAEELEVSLNLILPDGSNTPLDTVYGTNPMQIVIEAPGDNYLPDHSRIRVRVDTPSGENGDSGAGGAFQQEFELYATMFYFGQPPTDYTIASSSN